MRSLPKTVLATLALGLPAAAAAEPIRADLVGGSVQLGGELVLSVRPVTGDFPEGTTCKLWVAPPYGAHVRVVSDNCAELRLVQSNVPVRDATGAAAPSGSAPYEIRAVAPDGTEIGAVSGVFPYNNGFSDIRIVIRGIRNPVAPGESFEAEVLGAGRPVDPSLICRWNTYGPVRFEPGSENGCTGTLTATAPDGRDADMDVGIFNPVDMHAVGYATAKMLVK